MQECIRSSWANDPLVLSEMPKGEEGPQDQQQQQDQQQLLTKPRSPSPESLVVSSFFEDFAWEQDDQTETTHTSPQLLM